MRFTLSLGMGGYQDYNKVAVTAEKAGWSSICIPDSVFFPKTSESNYPYAETATVRKFLSQTPFIEPFVAMAAMAALTQKIRFFPSVLKVPSRQPLLLAKSLGSLAVICDNRVSLGAGIGPWKEDFTYNGLAFEKRGKMLDECIDIIRGVLSGEFFEYHGQHYDFGPLKMSPAPSKAVPILIGGHSKAALARAARMGDGWVSANADYQTIKTMIGQLSNLRDEYQTQDRTDFEIHAFDQNANTLDQFKRLRDIGVTDICTSLWNVYMHETEVQTKLDRISRFGDEVISCFE